MQPTVPLLLEEVAARFPGHVAQLAKDSDSTFQPTSFRELLGLVDRFAAGLRLLGVGRGDRVGLVSENRSEWLVADLAVLSLGAIDVPRGNDTTVSELAHILGAVGCQVACVEDGEQVRKIVSVKQNLPLLRTIIVLAPGQVDAELVDAAGETVLVRADELIERGREEIARAPMRIHHERMKGSSDDVATIIFTSGTTGTPKGVMLSHRNFLHQVEYAPDRIQVVPGDIWLCVLPVWHSFERIMQYISLGSASTLAYSKPIGRIMVEDMAKVCPTWMASVPRVWDSIMASAYRKIRSQGRLRQSLFRFFISVGRIHSRLSDMLFGRLPRFKRRVRVLDAALALVPWVVVLPLRVVGNLLVFRKIAAVLGGRFVAGISGGGALPAAVDTFFQAIGVVLLEGYGLTESGPILAIRDQRKPVAGTVGPVFPGTEIRIVDDERKPLPPGRRGVIMARGPQVMNGYYEDSQATSRVLGADGWLDTGDLGMLTRDNELKITGRAKDTIVLLGGENIEPVPIEQSLTESEYIDHAVLQGQDQKTLGVLIVPNRNAVVEYVVGSGLAPRGATFDALFLEHKEVQSLFVNLVKDRVSCDHGLRAFERIGPVALVPGPFSVGDELSQKQEVKRHAVAEKYADVIDSLFRR